MNDQSKAAKQRNELARLQQDRTAHLAHIGRLRRLLANALDNAPGWQGEASKELGRDRIKLEERQSK